MRSSALLLAFCSLVASVSALANDIKQTTTGSCSPTVVGNGNVNINCNNIPQPAWEYLTRELEKQKLTAEQALREKDDWIRKYFELDRQLTEARIQAAANGDDTTLIKLAQDQLHEGKLEEAGKIYDRLLARDESNVDRAAEDHFKRAQIFELQFRPIDARPLYAKAYQYRPDNVAYALAYSGLLARQNQLSEAEKVFNDLLPNLRDLAAKEPAVYRVDYAGALNNLGNVYAQEHQFDKAESAHKESVNIWRDLARDKPATYRSNLALALTGQGSFYYVAQQYGEAESAFT